MFSYRRILEYSQHCIKKMWLIHFPLNNILIFIFPLFLFLFGLHETDKDLQTTDLKRKPGPTTYKGLGRPSSHFPSVLLKRTFFLIPEWGVLSSLFIICCQKIMLSKRLLKYRGLFDPKCNLSRSHVFWDCIVPLKGKKIVALLLLRWVLVLAAGSNDHLLLCSLYSSGARA